MEIIHAGFFISSASYNLDTYTHSLKAPLVTQIKKIKIYGLAIALSLLSLTCFAQANKAPEIWSGSYSEMIQRGEIRKGGGVDVMIEVI